VEVGKGSKEKRRGEKKENQHKTADTYHTLHFPSRSRRGMPAPSGKKTKAEIRDERTLVHPEKAVVPRHCGVQKPGGKEFCKESKIPDYQKKSIRINQARMRDREHIGTIRTTKRAKGRLSLRTTRGRAHNTEGGKEPTKVGLLCKTTSRERPSRSAMLEERGDAGRNLMPRRPP